MNTDRTASFIIMLLFLAMIVYLFVRYWLNPNLDRSLKKTGVSQMLEEKYATAITGEKDVNKLTSNAVKMLKGNQLNCALINLKQATKVDQNYKESWFWLGYAYLQNNQLPETISALKEAAKIDPIDSRTYQYLAIAYEQSGNIDSSKSAKEKYEYLAKQK